MEKGARDSVFFTAVHYASSNLFQKLLALVTALVRPKLLSPELFGLWTVLNILPNYASYLHLGTRSALRFKVPVYKAHNDQENIEAVEAAVYHGTFYPSVALAGILLLVAYLLDARPEMRAGLVFVAVLVMLNWRFDYQLVILKAHQRFRLISVCNYLRAPVMLGLTVVLIVAFGFYGALAASVLALLVAIVFLEDRAAIPRPGCFRLRVFTDLVAAGFPIMAFNLITELLRTVDRFILLFTTGEEVVGYYGIAIMVSGFALSVPATSREVVEPRLMENLDRGPLAENVERFLVQPLLNTAFFMPVLIGVGVLLLPPFVETFLPDYVPGIGAAKILLLGAYFLALAYAVRGLIVAFRRQAVAAWLAFAALALNVTLSLSMVYLGYGAEGVAAASSLSFSVFLVLLLGYVYRQVAARGVDFGRRLLPMLLPFPIMCVLVVLPAQAFGIHEDSATVALAAKMVVFLVGQGALLELARRRGVVALHLSRQ